MAMGKTYEKSVLESALKIVREQRFRQLIADIDYQVSMDSAGNHTNAGYYIDQMRKKYNLRSIWYLQKTSDGSLVWPKSSLRYVMSVLVVCDTFLAVIQLRGTKPNFNQLSLDTKKRHAWGGCPSLYEEMCSIVPLSSITDSPITNSHYSSTQHEGFVTTRTVERKPNYLGAAIVGGAIGGDIGAVAAMSYEASRSGTKTVSHYVKPSVTWHSTGEITLSVSGPRVIHERKPTRFSSISTSDGGSDGVGTITVGIPRSSKNASFHDGNDTGEYNVKLEHFQHQSVAGALESMRKDIEKEVRKAVIYDRRLEWFGIEIEEPFKLTDEQISVMSGSDVDAAYAAMAEKRAKQIEARLRNLSEEEARLTKRLGRAKTRAKFFKKSGQKAIDETEAALKDVQAQIAALTEDKNGISTISGS